MADGTTDTSEQIQLPSYFTIFTMVCFNKFWASLILVDKVLNQKKFPCITTYATKKSVEQKSVTYLQAHVTLNDMHRFVASCC